MTQEHTRSELEDSLIAAHNGELGMLNLLQQLMDTQVFMPVKDTSTVAGLQTSDKAEPLALEAEDGTQVLILFTSPERAKDFLQSFPDFKGGLLAEFSWIIEKMGQGNYGISINPDWEYGLDLDSDMLQQFFQ